MLAAGIGVLLGAALERYISPQALKTVAGIAFIGVGIWTIASR